MSEQTNVSLVAVMSFAVGILVGAVISLFLAPMSGRELRGRIGEEARAEWQWANEQLARTQADMRQQMEGMRQQMREVEQRTRDQLSAQLNQLQAIIEKQATTEEEGE